MAALLSLLPLPLLLPLACRLDACAVAGLLMGNITNWDDPALVALNPDVRVYVCSVWGCAGSPSMHSTCCSGAVRSCTLQPASLPACLPACPAPNTRQHAAGSLDPPPLHTLCLHLRPTPALQAALPSEPVTLVYLNLSMPITQSLT
jgi:hypothetical protein